jgi:hypothetical protein
MGVCERWLEMKRAVKGETQDRVISRNGLGNRLSSVRTEKQYVR